MHSAVMQIKAVTFDVGGTLIQPWPSVGHIYAEVAARRGLKMFSAEQLNARFDAAWQARKTFEHSRHAWSELVDEVFSHPAIRLPSETFFQELYDVFAQPAAWRVFPDVTPALDALVSQGIRLGIISNWDERLRGLLRRLGLDRYFETWIISHEVGFNKPSRMIFRQAATEFDLQPEAILHVGDSLETDIAGAREVGFHALQILRTGNQPVDGVLHSLAELPARIGQLSREN